MHSGLDVLIYPSLIPIKRYIHIYLIDELNSFYQRRSNRLVAPAVVRRVSRCGLEAFMPLFHSTCCTLQFLHGSTSAAPQRHVHLVARGEGGHDRASFGDKQWRWCAAVRSAGPAWPALLQ
jgi:hypothetical protein